MDGATKRVGGVDARNRRRSQTRFVAVRFGNVLGSNGSVVPFSSTRSGQPGDFDAPDMQRYFMLIPEASGLSACCVIAAAPFVQDMGQSSRRGDGPDANPALRLRA
jgi:FlaA1/EpsC-like NDP-sugar epimerase